MIAQVTASKEIRHDVILYSHCFFFLTMQAKVIGHGVPVMLLALLLFIVSSTLCNRMMRWYAW